MKIRVLKDSKGNILATMELAFNDAYVDVVAEDGNRVEEMEVPEDYVVNLEKFYKTEKNNFRLSDESFSSLPVPL